MRPTVMGAKKVWIAVAIVVLAVGYKIVTTLNGPSDEKLVQQALANSITASREGRPGGVMDYLSESLKLNDQEPGRRQIAEFIKNSHPDIEVQNPQPVIRQAEGTAQITSPVRIKLSLPGGMSYDRTIPNVTLQFQREDAKEWLVIPTKQWRLISVSVPTESIPQDIPAGIGS